MLFRGSWTKIFPIGVDWERAKAPTIMKVSMTSTLQGNKNPISPELVIKFQVLSTRNYRRSCVRCLWCFVKYFWNFVVNILIYKHLVINSERHTLKPAWWSFAINSATKMKTTTKCILKKRNVGLNWKISFYVNASTSHSMVPLLFEIIE